VTDGEYPDQIVQTGPNGGTYNHNTFGHGASIRFGDPNGCGLVTNVTFTNNILTGGMNLTEGQSASTFTRTFNYGAGGSTAISGAPTYVGGTYPSAWPGWQLAAGSTGKGAASDGRDIGSNSFGQSTSTSPTPPGPATNLRIVR
jgi:hypothetical protein